MPKPEPSLARVVLILSENKILYILQDKFRNKWPDKSTTSYAMQDFKSDIENLSGKYLVIESHILQITNIHLQY